MSLKVVQIKNGKAYTSTTVPFERSLLQIKVMLENHNCKKIAEMRDTGDKYTIYTLVFEHLGIHYIIEFPVTFVVSQGGNSRFINMNISGRIIHDRIKSLLIAADIEYLSFSQAMMEYLAVKGPNGMISLSQQIEECGEKQLQNGFDIRMCLPGGDS